MSAFEDFVKTELPVRPVVQTNEDEETLLVRRGIIPRQYQVVEIADGELLGKEGGVIKGVANGASDKHYTHSQNVASSTWSITHGLSKYPSVTIVDSGGTIVEGDVTIVDVNNIQIEFSASFSGKCYCN